ncbi:MAG: CPBP family intramembrane glutamic endopeptidase [bacterium]|nr:CPBP family intramembrane glutamic endopeptidase [bacterium]
MEESRSRPSTSRLVKVAGFVIAFTIPYFLDTWWKFGAGTAMLLLLSRRLWPDTWRERLGLSMSAGQFGISVALLVGFATLFRILVINLVSRQGIWIDDQAIPALWKGLPIFQTLNEEILFRSVLQGWLIRRLGSDWSAIILMSGAFSAAHWGLYQVDLGQGTLNLSWQALWSLFAFSCALGLMASRSGHIGTCWALHLGWNLTQFGAIFRHPYPAGGWQLGEAETFLLLEGSAEVSLLSTLCFAGALTYRIQGQLSR